MNAYYAQWDVSDLNSWMGFEADTNQENNIEKSDYMQDKEDCEEAYALFLRQEERRLERCLDRYDYI